MLLEGAVAAFETSIFNEIPAGDHTLVLLRLHAIGQSDDDEFAAGLPPFRLRPARGVRQ